MSKSLKAEPKARTKKQTVEVVEDPAVLAAKELLARRHAREGIEGFTTYTYPNYIVGPPHKVIFDAIDEAIDGTGSKRLIFLLPPRTGKSVIVSRRLPAYFIGRFPDKDVVTASYEEGLATEFGRDVRNLVADVRFSNVFPNVHLSEDSNAAGKWNTEQGGGYHAVGVGSGLTGRGAHLGIIDDPIKDRLQADSETYRERLKAWYQSTFYTRLYPDSIVILCMTRWHHNDLAGWLMSEPDGDKWRVIHLPALAEPNDPLKRKVGEALWPEKFPVKELIKIKKAIGPVEFESLYQGNPTIQEGSILKREYFQFWNPTNIPPEFDEELISVDPNLKETKTGSEAVAHHWGRSGPYFYLLDRIGGRWAFNDFCDNIQAFCMRRKQAGAKLFEDTAAGPAIRDVLKSKIGGIIPVKPKGSKEIRAKAIVPYLMAKNIFVPEPSQKFPWVEEFLMRCAQFPNSADMDDVDTMTQAINYWIAEIGQPFEIGYDTGSTGPGDLSNMSDSALEELVEKHGDMTVKRLVMR